MRLFKIRLLFIIIAVVYIFTVTSAYAIETTDQSRQFGEDNFRGKQIGVELLKMRIYNFEGREMFKLRDLAEKCGWSIQYDSISKEITLINNGKSMVLDLDQRLSKDVKLIEGRSYLSIEKARDVFEEVGENTKLITGLYTDQEEYMTGNPVTAHIRVYNMSKESIKLDFSSGQRYDLYLERDNKEIWRWSDGKFFTMALARVEIEAGDSMEFDVEIDTDKDADLTPGKYILSGELAIIGSAIELNDITITVSKE
ncbi:MAG: BsuPI-related putative proteinase inhibitor [Halanaerobiales bacterium]